MHLKDDMLRAYLDHEMASGQYAQAREHLTRCKECAGRLEQVRARARQVRASLDLLAPGPRELPRPAQAAYQRFQIHPKEPQLTMFKNRTLWAAIAVLAVLALLFSLTPVRAWASSFLGLFRVEKITVIPFDPTQLEQTHGQLADQQGSMEALFEDNIQIKEQGEITKVESAAQAVEQAGFTPRLPQLPDQTPTLYIKPGLQATFILDQPRLQAVLDVMDIDVSLPAEVDGKEIHLDVQTAVAAAYGDCPEQDPTAGSLAECTVLIQLPSPTVETPAGIDVPKLGEAMLQVLGLSEEEARSLSASIDWTSTLILPIPQGEEITYEDVVVDGVSGTYLESTENNTYTLVWVKNGRLYMLAGAGGKEAARAFVTALP